MDMSRHTTDLSDSSIDSFLPSMGREAPSSIKKDPIDGNNLATYDPCLAYSPLTTGCTDVLDDSNFNSPFTVADTPSRNETSGRSTPDFTGYTFGQRAHTLHPPSAYHATPAPDTPHPYPAQLQQQGFANSNPQSCQRPLPVRSATNTSYLRPPARDLSRGRINQPSHPRSSSQRDVDRIAAAVNPQLIRLQTPRARSAAPPPSTRNTSRIGPYIKANRNATRHGRTTSNLPTSIPSSMQGHAIQQPSHILSWERAVIGIPFEEETRMNMERGRGMMRTVVGGNGMRVQITGPGMEYMRHEEQTGESTRIIEIGAMAVVRGSAGQENRGKNQEPRTNGDVLKMINQVEDHLKRQEDGSSTKGLSGCKMIREALSETGPEVPRTTINVSHILLLMCVSNRCRLNNDPACNETDTDVATPLDLYSHLDNDMCAGALDKSNLITLLENDLKANGFGASGT